MEIFKEAYLQVSIHCFQYNYHSFLIKQYQFLQLIK